MDIGRNKCQKSLLVGGGFINASNAQNGCIGYVKTQSG